MEDTKIIKALERCTEGSCAGCPANKNNASCLTSLVKNALDLINRKKAEIERLEGGCSNCSVVQAKSEVICDLHEQIEYWQRGYNDLREGIKTARTEAIKEFAERLKAKCSDTPFIGVIRFATDAIVKEMVGDE